MVSYHPDEGDAFAPDAAKYRLQRYINQHNNTSIPGYPSFVVNNGVIREDVPSWPDVTSDILRAESNQRGYTMTGKITGNSVPSSRALDWTASSTTPSGCEFMMLRFLRASSVYS